MYKLIHATVVLPMQNGSNNSLPQSIKSTNPDQWWGIGVLFHVS